MRFFFHYAGQQLYFTRCGITSNTVSRSLQNTVHAVDAQMQFLWLKADLAVDAQIRMCSLFANAVLLVHALSYEIYVSISFLSFRATFLAIRRLNLRVPPGGAFSDLDT